MIKNTLLGCALAAALSAGPAIAANFHALAGLQGTTPTPLEDEALAAMEGGTLCTVTMGMGPGMGFISLTADSGIAGGACVIGIVTNSTGHIAIFGFASTVTFAANFLQLVP